MLNVLAGYMQLLMDYEAIDAAQAQVDVTSAEVEQTQKFVDFGKLAELNLLQIQSQLASDKLTKVIAENQLQLDKLVLLQLMETPVRSDFDIVRQELSELFPEVPISTEEIDKISLSFLPQIKSASLRTDASQFSLKMAKSGRYPKLIMGGALQTAYSSINNDPLSNQFNNNFSQVLSFTLSVPIFNNFLARSAVSIAKINVLGAQLNEQQTKNDLRKNIEAVYTNQVSAGKKLVAIKEALELEKRTYIDMGKKYSIGALGATDYLIEKNNTHGHRCKKQRCVDAIHDRINSYKFHWWPYWYCIGCNSFRTGREIWRVAYSYYIIINSFVIRIFSSYRAFLWLVPGKESCSP